MSLCLMSKCSSSNIQFRVLKTTFTWRCWRALIYYIWVMTIFCPNHVQIFSHSIISNGLENSAFNAVKGKKKKITTRGARPPDPPSFGLSPEFLCLPLPLSFTQTISIIHSISYFCLHSDSSFSLSILLTWTFFSWHDCSFPAVMLDTVGQWNSYLGIGLT